MKRTVTTLSLIAVLFIATIGHAAKLQTGGEKLTKQQLLTLIAMAKTPAEHQRIADYYEAKAQDFLDESQMHKQMAQAFKANPLTSSPKFASGTVGHCEYLAKSLKSDSERYQRLAKEHEKMAEEAKK